jgi:cobalt/nickel transport protein
VSARRLGWFIGGGLLVALLLAGVVSNFASASPDGLDATVLEGCTLDEDGNITGGQCLAQQEQEHQLGDSPLADYGFAGIDNPFLSTALSGVAGVLLTFVIGGGLFWLVRRRGGKPADGTGEPADGAGDEVAAGAGSAGAGD